MLGLLLAEPLCLSHELLDLEGGRAVRRHEVVLRVLKDAVGAHACHAPLGTTKVLDLLVSVDSAELWQGPWKGRDLDERLLSRFLDRVLCCKGLASDVEGSLG